MIRLQFQQFKSSLPNYDKNVTDFAKSTPFAISSLELDLPTNNDLVMLTPFEEPDVYFTGDERKPSEHEIRPD